MNHYDVDYSDHYYVDHSNWHDVCYSDHHGIYCSDQDIMNHSDHHDLDLHCFNVSISQQIRFHRF